MTRLGYVLVQLDYSDALFVMTAHASVIQGLPANQISAHQIGYSSRSERLRCLGLYRGTVNHPEGDAWSRHSDPARIAAEYSAYTRDPSSYIRGNPGRGPAEAGKDSVSDAHARGTRPPFAAAHAQPPPAVNAL
eukprot:CAMPEP_0179444536 /NCGR_PEP_ID=MMETSP0799-20121207/27978_1 /TAXON_ID=46947 /ORGANISM="Geminigera cryophila, Strain CCMP2564" /LENGTH=133 /DNA_ID=CAMNT_0021231669 /DNA_START=50 /DNA_END=451 /DNA_ORIENTATION=+